MRISDWSSDVCSSDLPSQVGGFLDEKSERGTWAFGQFVAVSGQDRRGGGEGGQWSAQLVAEIGDKATFSFDPLLQRVDHRVERFEFGGQFSSVERRVGQEFVRTCRFGGWPYH